MEPVNLNSRVTNPHRLKKLDIMKGKSERQQKSSGSKPLAQSPSKGGCVQVRVRARSLILGQMWKKNFSINQPIFKKRGLPTQNNSESLVHINVRRKPKPTVKNYQRLGYISYEATTSTWVTFSYELTGWHLPPQLRAISRPPFGTGFTSVLRCDRSVFATNVAS